MKKVFASTLAAMMFTFCGIAASAESYDQNSTGTPGTNIVFEYVADPVYTITIPAAITLEKDGSSVAIEASDVENLGGQKISVTIAGTNYYRNQFVLEGRTVAGRSTSLRYSITTSAGEVMATTGERDQFVGKQLVSFANNGTSSYGIAPLIDEYTEKSIEYTGTIIYGIELI